MGKRICHVLLDRQADVGRLAAENCSIGYCHSIGRDPQLCWKMDHKAFPEHQLVLIKS
jgi:hypothetical protein